MTIEHSRSCGPSGNPVRKGHKTHTGFGSIELTVGKLLSRRLRSVTDHLTYVNVAATIALFVSLGGVSYAAVAIPAHSVGARQLRPGAVTTTALGFPLGAAGITDSSVEDLTRTPCNAPAPPGVPSAVACPQLKQTGVTVPGREVHLSLRVPGEVLVSSIAGLHDEGAPTASAVVTLYLIVDGKLATNSSSSIAGGQSVQLPAQVAVRLPAGAHSVGVEAQAKYSTREPGDVMVSPVSLTATALPPVS